ncbi:MAG: amidohydrolase, partial [Acidobacteriota bacterium]
MKVSRRTSLVSLMVISLLAGAPPSALPLSSPQETEEEKEKPSWKVDEPHGPTREISFTTDEGTWLSLDVHPEGETIVFSLLGDLYLLPIEGGEAKRITHGPAYDVQPRFSPEGNRIAFASDRGGTENLWTCDLDGNNARQISREKETFINSPAWSPKGEYLVGRKRLTDRSSLGTVELWMWHVKGGEGIQLTKKDEQPDAADPVVSPDGRFIYFSARDSRFRYDRNVYQGIWQIKRFDRVTGQVVPMTREYGGAAAPRLSPDGKTLAFIRRDRGQTVLELLDLVTGQARRLASGLERDLQESFSFHGVFPGYAWTPDGRSLIATADGKIGRWNVESGERSAIPFQAKVEHRTTEALRFRPEIDTESLRVRIFRWPVESPDGKRLAVSALGHLYAMDLPGGRPRRITKRSELEYAPAYSPGGEKLAFVTWSDADGGHVWWLPTDGSAPAVRLTEHPAQYVNPAFSPDGTKIVFVKGSGAAFRDHDLSDELWHEIHWVNATGGPTHYVIGTKNRGTNRRVTRPHFSPAGERIYFLENEPAEKPNQPPKSVLVSVKLDGTDHRKHLRWDRADEAMVSPDGGWVIFNEQHNAWLTALPAAGSQTVDVNLKSSALPLTQLTEEGGEWVNWADGGRTLTWIFGTRYHRLALDKAFPTPEAEEKGKKKLPASESLEIGLTVPRARPTEAVAYTGARLITMKGDEVIEGGVIWVEGNRIRAVGEQGSVPIPPGVRTVDVSGRTVVPGLFDEHAHLHYSTLDVFPQRPW